MQKWAYPANYLRIQSTDHLDQQFSFDRMWVGIISQMFVLRLLNGRCYGNQLIWGTFLQTSNLTASSLCTVYSSCSDKECSSSIYIRESTLAMMKLHRVKIW